MDEDAFAYFIDSQFKYRAGRSGLVQPKSVIVVDDLKAHYTKRIKDKLKALNTTLVVLSGGLTPKAQLCDTHVNYTYKHNIKNKQTRNRLAQYKEAKRRARESGQEHGTAFLKKMERISKIEHLQVMASAYADIQPNLGITSWETVKMMPYELARATRWDVGCF